MEFVISTNMSNAGFDFKASRLLPKFHFGWKTIFALIIHHLQWPESSKYSCFQMLEKLKYI